MLIRNDISSVNSVSQVAVSQRTNNQPAPAAASSASRQDPIGTVQDIVSLSPTAQQILRSGQAPNTSSAAEQRIVQAEESLSSYLNILRATRSTTLSANTSAASPLNPVDSTTQLLSFDLQQIERERENPNLAASVTKAEILVAQAENAVVSTQDSLSTPSS